MQFERHDTEVTVTLPEHYHGYFTSKFKLDEIETVTSKQQRIWIGILNRSLTETILIQKKTDLLDFCARTKQRNWHQTWDSNSEKQEPAEDIEKKRMRSGGFSNG